MNLSVVILAAGQGMRMKSDVPKILHPVAGKPIVAHLLDAACALDAEKIVIVLGHASTQVREAITNYHLPLANIHFVEQREQLGTGHAALQARDALRDSDGVVLILYADHPLYRTETFRNLIACHTNSNATLSILTALSDDSMGFGRVVRNASGAVQGVVEEANATPEQRAIRELNCGTYCVDAKWLWEHLAQIQKNPVKQEYYLTDIVEMAVNEKCTVESVQVQDVKEILGVNTRVHLAHAEKIMRARINERLMLDGVTLVDPDTTYIDATVDVRRDTIIEPGTHLRGKTTIGANCRIGPNSIITDAQIGNECIVLASVIESATLEDHVDMGPFARLRPGTYLARGVHLGNYVEVKNSRLGEKSQAGHFSYLGDAEIGARVNIGAGTITANFDGMKKNKTIIGDDAFIGSDTVLVAPVTIGARSRTGAGAVVTKDVPSGTLAVGLPARVIRKLE